MPDRKVQFAVTLITCLALFVVLTPQSALAQTTLNLSQDLVQLGIAPTNMVPNQPTLDAGPLFVQGVEYARSHGIARVIANPGSYYFLSLLEVNAHFALRYIDNMTIDLQGADLIFTHPLYYGMIVYYSTNAVIQNFTADYQPLPFTQVRVVAVDTANAQIQYVVEPGWQDPSAFNSAQLPPGGGPPIVEVHIFRNGRPAFGTRRMATQRPFTGNRFTMISYGGFDPTPAVMATIRPGDTAVVVMKSFAEPVNSNHCSACTLRNITVFSSPSGGVQAIDAQSSVMERVYSIPKPGTDRLVSTFGIAIFPFVGPNHQMRLSRAIRTMDDGLVFGGQFIGTVQNQISSRRLIVEGSGGPSVLGGGDTVPNGSPVNFQRLSDGVMLGPAIIVSQSAPTVSPPYQITFDFDRDLPSNLTGTVMYATDANQNGANSVLERSTVQDTSSCCKGIYLNGLANSGVRGNYIRRTAFSGVFLVDSTAPGDPPTPPLVNLNVANNVIDGTNMTSDWWWFEFGSIQTVTLTTAYDLMITSPFSNINVANNFIADSGRSAVWIGNTAGGSVSSNYLLDPNARPDLANAYPPRVADALRPMVIDTTSSGVTTANNVVDKTSRRMFVTDTQYRELAAYSPGGTIRLNAHNLGALANPAVTLTDADGITTPLTIQNTAAQALDVQLPAAAGLGGAFVTLTAGGAKNFGTLFIDSQDNVPAVNGCTYEPSLSSTSVLGSASSVPILIVTQAGCSYQVLANDPFVSPGGGAAGTAVISVGFAANTGLARSTTIEIAGQPITLTQFGINGGGPFTDANLNGVSVKAVHITDLRARIGILRTLMGLPLFQWTDPVLSQGSTAVRATHVQELRAALNDAYVAAGRPAPQYTDATVVAGSTVVRAVHITELRSAVIALEQP